jgi:hypothetical protein
MHLDACTHCTRSVHSFALGVPAAGPLVATPGPFMHAFIDQEQSLHSQVKQLVGGAPQTDSFVQVALQVVPLGGSHCSPASTTPLPHTGAQSLSLLLLQLAGQQPSPLIHWVIA